MNILIWSLLVFVAFAFIYSGVSKSIFSEQKLISLGQTGIEGLPLSFIRFIGVSELLGVIGLILPRLLHIAEFLTIWSVSALGCIMIPASIIHYRRKEYQSVTINFTILSACLVLLCLLIP